MRRFLVLVLVNILLLGIIVQAERSRSQRLKGHTPGALRIHALKVSSLDLSEVQGPKRWTLELGPSGWALAHPHRGDADPILVESLLKELQFLEAQEIFKLEDLQQSGKNLEDWGLQSGALHLELTQSNKKKRYRVSFQEKTYVLDFQEEKIFIFPSKSLSLLNTSAENFFQKTLFSHSAFQVDAIKIEKPSGERVRLQKQAKRWEIEKPIAVAADSFRVQTVLAELTQLCVTPSRRAPPATSPRLTLSLFAKDKRETLFMYEPSEDEPDLYWAQREGFDVSFKVPAVALEAFLHPIKHLRDRSVFEMHPESLTQIELCNATGCVRIAPDTEGTWRVEERGSHHQLRVDTQLLEERIKDLELLRIEAFVEDEPTSAQLRNYGLHAPQLQLRVNHKDHSKSMHIGSLDPQTQTLYAQEPGKPYVYTLPARLLKRFPVHAHAYRSRLFKRFPEGSRLVSLTLKDAQTNAILHESSQKAPSFCYHLLEPHILNFWVQDYLPLRTDETHLSLDADTRLPWLYRIEAKVQAPDSRQDTLQVFSFVVTKRVGAALQYAAAEGICFSLTSTWIDCLAQLDLPKQASESGKEHVP